ncbi:MFS transporter [Photobacterium atrarenae]|uniref:MFS transporter n=1 Tax=Photobacterium atrarenae TaxID=865757 RepID=A0ABY5GMM7_9GAMM|nr:MFS transporter [Photobacterium atrarenae]UTV30560.1 MFS transporter [Photobacterium atrarenae]
MDVVIENRDRRAKGTLSLLCVVQFLVALDALVVIPLSAEIVLSLAVSPEQAGYLNSSYALAAALASVLFRPAATPEGMLRVMRLALLGLGAVTLGFACAPGFIALLAMRCLAGGFAGVVVALNLNLLMILLAPEKRKQAVALVMGMFPLALTLGVPGLLQLSGGVGWQAAFLWLGGGLLVAAGVVILRDLKQDQVLDSAASRADSMVTSQATGKETAAEVLSGSVAFPNRGLGRPLLAVFLAVFSTFLIVTQYPVFLVAGLKVATESLSCAYIIGGAGTFLTFQVYGRWGQRINSQWLIAGLSTGMVLVVLAGFSTQDAPQALAGLIGFMILSATRTTVVVTEITCALSAQLRARFIGYQNALMHLGSGVAGMAGAGLVVVSDSGVLSYQILLWVAAVLIMSVPLIRVPCESESQ